MSNSSVVHACTVDVEDYYQVSAFDHVFPRDKWDEVPERVTASTERVLALLADAGVLGTFFILGRVADRCPNLIRRIAAAGHELGCHSHDHRLVHALSKADFREDLRRSKGRIEDLAGSPVTAYRAPSFSIVSQSLWALDVLAEEGFEFDSSVYPIFHDRYGIADAPHTPYRIETPSTALTEFPPTTMGLLGRRLPAAGGGYFRLYPYWLTAYAIRRAEANGLPANLYVHPWEFDPDQPEVAGIAFGRRFRHRVGLKKTAIKFARLLRDFRFGTLTEALATLPPLPTFEVVRDRLVPIMRRRIEKPSLAEAGAS
jgi:polysaccharide deacetylase family protein (PEP-CTERM system associated)